MKLLVAEDDLDILDDINSFFVKEGFEVRSCSNGLEALTALNSFTPDIIISDIMMPYLDGFELFEKVKSNFMLKSIPFIFLTAKADLNSIRKGMNLGADDYLTKPFNFDELLLAVNTRIDKYKSFNEKLTNIKEQISKYVPHELRTPLVGILGFSNILKNEIDCLSKDDIIEMVEKIELSGKRLLNVVEKFLKYTELDSLATHKWDEHDYLSQIDLAAFQEIVINHYFIKDRIEKIIFNIHPSPVKIPLYFFKTIITELLENCVKYSPSNSIIEIKGVCNNNFYCIDVVDHGFGITKEQILNIDYLQQFDRAQKEISGNGIGLAMVKKILSIIEGTFNIESEPNKFTKVFISFPKYL